MSRILATVCIVVLATAPAVAEKFVLVTGVDAGHYPAAGRIVAPSPGPGFPGTFYDGDRLAGSPGVGPAIVYQGVGTPLFAPNQFGSLSMLFRRGSIPAGGSNRVPLMGIEFLGGPRLDLDGDLTNRSRSLIPVGGETPVVLPGRQSFIDLDFDLDAGAVTLVNVDATGTNEGGPNLPPQIATVMITLAGTGPNGGNSGPTNPDIDTRIGSVSAYTGRTGTLTGVYQIADLGFELWEDSIDEFSGTADLLGTMQFLGTLRGWLVERDPQTGQFPVLTGQDLGSTLWPAVDAAAVGMVVNTANGLAGGSATIAAGVPQDQFTAPNNGGLALTAYGGDLGGYLDAVVVPLLSPTVRRFVYLESVGFGVNNSGDPVFTDTIGYDVVIIAASPRELTPTSSRRAPAAGSVQP
jgi:hypothetical protein